MERNAGKKFQKSYFDVLGLCCSSEVPMIERILNSLDGVKGFSVVVPTRTLIVVHDSLLISQIQIVEALNESRLEASIRVYGHSNYKNKWPSPYAVTCGALLVLSFLKYVYNPFKWLAIVAVLAGIPPVLLKALAAVRNLRVDINILVLITVSGSLALHDYWEAATIVFLFTISEWLESRASHKATSEMSSLISVVPQKAVIAETGEEINADEVKLGTVLAVKAGQVIPIDGVVIEGSCEVDEKIMTGESFPVTKQKDSAVWASTINLNGYISIKTTAVAEDCVVARMAKIVEEAQNKKSETQRFLDKCAKYYTPAIVVISASIALVPLAFHVRNKREWYHLALVVLVSGCPCALLLSTPVAMFCALSKAATLGVLFKGAQHLETLARIKIMAFDKTGTITRGEFLVVDLKSLMPEISSDELLYWISSIESKSSHPMAAALVDFARTHSIEPKPDKVENFQNFPGEGISGKIEDSEIYIGNSKIALRAGCTSVPKLEGYDTEGKSVGYVFLGSSPAAIFCLSDTCRTVAKETIQQLKSSGIKTVMLTGDCHGAAKLAQEQLGGALEVILAELLPEEKASMIKEFQKENPTAMIGDGLNDSPALATADIGISMGISGSALATESGDIVLMTNDIRRVPKALRIAKQVRRKVIENVILSISTKAAIVGLAIAGHPLVWAAVLADVGTCLLVIFNSMLILRVKSCCDSTKHSHSHKHESKNKNCHSAHSHSCNEDRIEDHQCCNKGDHDVESQKPHHHGCCSSSSVSEHRHPHPHSEGTVMNDSLHIHRHNDLQNEDKVEDHEDTVSQKPHHHGCCSSSSISEHRHPHTHSEGTVKNDSVHIHDHCPKTKKCFSSMKEHGHKHTDLQNEGKLEDHQCCNKGDHDLESQKTHYHGCCTSSSTSEHRHPHPHSEGIVMNDSVHIHDHCPETKKCSSSMKEHGHKHTDLQNEGKVEDHEHTVSHNHGCSENHNHRNSCEGQEKQKCKDHTHSKSNEGSWWKNVGNREHCRHKKQESGESGVCRGSKTMKLGCCDSFRRECCIRNGSHLRGGLSEIFID